MVATLPRNIQLKLDQTLNQWRHWRCDTPLSGPPQVVSAFESGVSNHSVLVGEEQRFVIRIDGVNAANNSLSRSWEWRVLHCAHEAGLAPCPRYYNPELGVLVCDYLPPDNDCENDLCDTAALLRSIHKLPAFHHRLDLRERFTRYEKQVEHQNRELPALMASCREKVLSLLATIIDDDDTPVPCHNDLLAANRIVSGKKLRAIDWEYCAMGSFWFDLAVVAIGDHLDSGQQQELLTAYLEREATPRESLKFSQNCLIYQYLELLWYLANTREAIEQRLRELQLALSRGNY